MNIDMFNEGDHVEAWYNGDYCRGTVYRLALTKGTLTIRFHKNISKKAIAGIAAHLVRHYTP